MVRPHG